MFGSGRGILGNSRERRRRPRGGSRGSTCKNPELPGSAVFLFSHVGVLARPGARDRGMPGRKRGRAARNIAKAAGSFSPKWLLFGSVHVLDPRVPVCTPRARARNRRFPFPTHAAEHCARVPIPKSSSQRRHKNAKRQSAADKILSPRNGDANRILLALRPPLSRGWWSAAPAPAAGYTQPNNLISRYAREQRGISGIYARRRKTILPVCVC